jgi:hypothetical protein
MTNRDTTRHSGMLDHRPRKSTRMADTCTYIVCGFKECGNPAWPQVITTQDGADLLQGAPPPPLLVGFDSIPILWNLVNTYSNSTREA